MGKRTTVTSLAAVAASLLAVGGATVAHADVTPKARFSQTVEAETDGIPSIDVHPVSCTFCSGGARMAGLGGHDNGDLKFYVRVPKEGDYTITVYYVSGHGHALSVNDKRLTGLHSAPGTVAKQSVTVHLKLPFGRPATIDLGYDTHTPGVDVDKLVITS